MKHTVNEMHCKSGDNNIFGVMYLPAEMGDKLPVVILSHGYNSSYSHVLDMAQCLAESGFAAYCYDFCGGSTISKSDGKSTDMSIATEIADLKNVIRMLSGLDYIDKDRLFLYGESQGGFVSALTAAEIPEKISGMALLYPAFCIPDNWLPRDPEEMTEPVDFMGMKLSRKFRDELPDYDVFEAVKNFTKPVIVHHGDADGLVDIAYAERISRAFPDCRLHIYENEGHGFSAGARKILRERTAEFFERLAF